MKIHTKRSPAGYKVREVPLDVKATAADGTFSGYGSVFGVVDSYNEIVAAGAFKRSLGELAAKGRKLPILYQHRAGEPLGVYSDVHEDDTGLWVEGAMLIDKIGRAAETHALMSVGAITGLSIGYYVEKYEVDNETNVITLTDVELVEVSVVTFPANDAARIETIKAKLAHGAMPTLPEFERFLRDAGFSKTQAAVLANRGLAHLLAGVEAGGPDADMGDPLEAAKAFRLPSF